MAFYLRKAFSFGPIRLNLSKSGFGLSAGVTGARIGMGPRGPYLHGGRYGLYYRKSLKGLGGGSPSSRSWGSQNYTIESFPPQVLYTNETLTRANITRPQMPGLAGAGSLAALGGCFFAGGKFDKKVFWFEY